VRFDASLAFVTRSAMTDMASIPMIPFRARLVWFLETLLDESNKLPKLRTYASGPAKSSVDIWFAG
jgi:hypothetical protein